MHCSDCGQKKGVEGHRVEPNLYGNVSRQMCQQLECESTLLHSAQAIDKLSRDAHEDWQYVLMSDGT